MSVLDPTSIAGRTSSNYPEPFRTKLAGREKRPLGEALGLKNFGVNHVRLPPGARSCPCAIATRARTSSSM